MMKLSRIRIENLRGYYDASLSLERSPLVLIGKNNAGKTSILRILDWLFNSLDLYAIPVDGVKPLSEEEKTLLLPARDARNRARRIWIGVRIDDRRRYRRFKCDRDGLAWVRIGVRQTPEPHMFLRLGNPTRQGDYKTDRNALALIQELRESYSFMHVPSFRDAYSPQFSRAFRKAVEESLAQRAVHNRQGGAPAEYREVIRAIASLKEVAERLLRPLWEAMRTSLVPGLVREGKFVLECQPEELVSWLASKVSLQLSTGDHDVDAVAPSEVGAGLQSLLDVGVKGSSARKGKSVILVIEEPEAFLHPSAQRKFGRLLRRWEREVRRRGDGNSSLIMTTHSSVIVEESEYREVVLVKEHEFYEPPDQEVQERNNINTSLMSGLGAEALFASAVLLVEGEGDRLFFEGLRRRVAEYDEDGDCEDLFIVSIGGKTRFAPWIRFLSSYAGGGQGGEQGGPISWFIVADGDAVVEVRRALRDAEVPLTQRVVRAFGEVHGVLEAEERAQKVRWLNQVLEDDGVAVCFMPFDLEAEALDRISAQRAKAFAEKFGADCPNGQYKDGLLRHLGSKKVRDSGGDKSAWKREILGKELKWREMGREIRRVMDRWVRLVKPGGIDELIEWE